MEKKIASKKEDFLKAILTAGIPFEKVCASKFFKEGWSVVEQYPIIFERKSGDEILTRESIGDIRASCYEDKKAIDLWFEAFVECKSRRKEKKWVFFEKTPYMLIGKTGLISVPHLVSMKTGDFGSYFDYHYLHIATHLLKREKKELQKFGDLSVLTDLSQCNAGLEIFSKTDESRQAIQKALGQVSLAALSGLKDFKAPTKAAIFFPVIVTNAELCVCKWDLSKDFEKNADLVPVDVLLYDFTLPAHLHFELPTRESGRNLIVNNLWIFIVQTSGFSAFLSTMKIYFNLISRKPKAVASILML